MSESKEIGAQILSMAPKSLALMKHSIDRSSDVNIDAGLEYEQRCSEIVAKSNDRKEGYLAFVEKRKPIFTGD